MKLSIRKESPHYHECVSFVDKVMLNDVPVDHCEVVDTKEGFVVVASLFGAPNGRMGNCQIGYKTIRGKAAIKWRTGNREYNDWLEHLIQQCEATHGSR